MLHAVGHFWLAACAMTQRTYASLRRTSQHNDALNVVHIDIVSKSLQAMEKTDVNVTAISPAFRHIFHIQF